MFITAVKKDEKNQKLFWQLNTPFLFYINMKRATVNNLKDFYLNHAVCILTLHCSVRFIYLRQRSAIFMGSLLWIGITVLLKNLKKSLTNAI